MKKRNLISADTSKNRVGSQITFPWNWKETALALSPGILALSGILRADFDAATWLGMFLLLLFVWMAYFISQRHFPAWSMLGWGFLAGLSQVIITGLVGGISALLLGRGSTALVIILLWTILLFLLMKSLRGIRVPGWMAALFALIIVCQLAVRYKYFPLYGFSWGILLDWLNISFYSAGVLLLPVAIGAWLAHRQGRSAFLFLLGALYIGIQVLSDNGGHISTELGGTPLFILYRLLPVFLVVILAPTLFVRGRSSKFQLLGTLFCMACALIFEILFSGLIRSDFSPLIWFSSIPYVISVLLTMWFSYHLFSIIEVVNARR